MTDVRATEMTDDTRDRVIRLEAQVASLKETLARAVTQIDEMHSVLMMAKGARWLTIAVASLVGLLIGTSNRLLAVLDHWSGPMPP